MTTTSGKRTERRGALIVETGMVLSIFILILFSIFEYGRFVMFYQLLDNAAREGCRYATVHNTDATVTTDVQNVITQAMAGYSLQGQAVTITATDNSGTDLATAVSSILPGDPIAVKITGNFQPMFPTLFYLPTLLPMRSKAIMTCEGN